MNTLLTFTHTRPKTTLLLLLLLTLLVGTGIPRLEVRNSFTGELPADAPINLAIERVKEDFGDRSIVLVGLEADDVYTPETVEKLVTLSREMASVPYVMADEVLSLATVQNVSNRSWGLETGGFLDEIPSNEIAWQQLRTDVAANEIVADKLVSKDGTLLVIAAALSDDFVGGEVYDAVTELVAPFRGPERIHITGAPILVEDVQRGISGDSRRFIPIAILLIFAGFYLCFRHWAGVFLPVGMVIMSIIWTMGAMGHLGLPITVVSNALPVIMVAVASSYGIHFMNAYYDLADQTTTASELVIATIDKIGLPILITGVTSALGSASLLIFKITSLQEFGIIGAIGFLFATLICLTLLPAMCTLVRKPEGTRRQSHWLNRQLFQLTRWTRRHRRWVWGGYLLLLPFFLYQAGNIKIGDDYLKFFPAEHPGRVAAETFNEHLSGVRVMDIVVDATALGGIKDQSFYRQIQEFQAYLTALPAVGSVYSYVNVIDHLQGTINSNESVRSDKDLAQYLMLHEMSATPGEVFALRTDDFQKAKMQVFLRSSNPEDHEALYLQIQRSYPAIFPGGGDLISFGGDVMHRIALSSYIVTGKVQNIILALLIVLLSCTLIFRSFRRGLLTLLPIVFSLIMVFGGMGLIGIRLGISTSLLTAMIVGIGIDFAVHYLVAFYRERQAKDHENALSATSLHTGKAIAYDALSNLIGFSVLSFSGFLPVQHFGWLLAFSMLLIFINTMVVYPAILSESAASTGKVGSLRHEIAT